MGAKMIRKAGLPVVVFAKPARAWAPLARRIGEADSALVLQRLLARTLGHLTRAGVPPVVAVPPDAPGFRAVAARSGARLMVQPRGRMGLKLARVLRSKKTGAILIDSDTPGLDAVLVRHARDALGLYDMVLGPNWSGGTYLIGLRSPAHAFGLLRHVRWGTVHMLEDILARAPRHWIVGLLPVLADAADRASLRDAAADHTPARRRSSRLGLITMKR